MIPRRARTAALLSLTLLAMSATAGSAPAAADGARDTLATGKAIYEAWCAACHGVGGDGRGLSAAGFEQPPTDFTRGTYKFRSTAGPLPTVADLERSIREGMSGTEMVPFKRILSDTSIARVAAYLATFSEDFRARGLQAENDRVALPAERSAPPSADSIAAGRELYREECADCHADRGQGTRGEEDDWGRPVKMIDFRLGYFKSGDRDADLYRSIAAGMKGTSMDAYADVLDEEEIWQVIDYIRSLADEPDGFFGRLLRALLVTEPNGFDYRGY